MLGRAAEFDVVIIGGGIVGTTLACLLGEMAKAGSTIRVALLEGQAAMTAWPPTEHGVDGFDPRVSALTLASQRLLDDIGAWPLMANSRVSPYREMHVWDAEGTGSIHFDAADVQQPALGHIVENRIIIAALQSQLPLYGNVSFLAPATVTGINETNDNRTPYQVDLETGQSLRSKLLVGADGGNSLVRRAAGFKTREWDYGHQALVATVETQQHHQCTAWQRFLPSGPLAFLPLDSNGEGRLSSIVWSMLPELAEQRMADDDAEFCRQLAAAFESRLGEVTAVSKRYSFPLRQRHATDYVKPGVVLVGDAAHTIHPLAGQGVNLGLLDVAVLSEELERALSKELELNSMQVLTRYQRRRKAHNLGMMGIMEGFKRLFGQQALPVRWLRNAGMRQVDQLAPLKQLIVKQAMGL